MVYTLTVWTFLQQRLFPTWKDVKTLVSSSTWLQPELILNGPVAHLGSSNIVLTLLKVWESACTPNIAEEC